MGPAVLFSSYGLIGLVAALATQETFGPQRRAQVAALTEQAEDKVLVGAGAVR